MCTGGSSKPPTSDRELFLCVPPPNFVEPRGPVLVGPRRKHRSSLSPRGETKALALTAEYRPRPRPRDESLSPRGHNPCDRILMSLEPCGIRDKNIALETTHCPRDESVCPCGQLVKEPQPLRPKRCSGNESLCPHGQCKRPKMGKASALATSSSKRQCLVVTKLSTMTAKHRPRAAKPLAPQLNIVLTAKPSALRPSIVLVAIHGQTLSKGRNPPLFGQTSSS